MKHRVRVLYARAGKGGQDERPKAQRAHRQGVCKSQMMRSMGGAEVTRGLGAC
jgi:hypothetical protein